MVLLCMWLGLMVAAASSSQLGSLATVILEPADGKAIDVVAVPRDSALLSREWRLRATATTPARGAWPRYYSRDSLLLTGPVNFTADIARGAVTIRSRDGRELAVRVEFVDGMVLSARGAQVVLTQDGATRRVFATAQGVAASPPSPGHDDAARPVSSALPVRPPVTSGARSGGSRAMAAIELVPGEGAGTGEVLVYTTGSAAFGHEHASLRVRHDTLRVALPVRLRADLTDGDLHFVRPDGQRVRANARMIGGVNSYFGDSPHVILDAGGTGVRYLPK